MFHAKEDIVPYLVNVLVRVGRSYILHNPHRKSLLKRYSTCRNPELNVEYVPSKGKIVINNIINKSFNDFSINAVFTFYDA